MKYFTDGNQLYITEDDFVDLQESPAVFYALDSEVAKTVLANGIGGLTVGDLLSIHDRLAQEKQQMVLVKAIVKTVNEMSKSVTQGEIGNDV